MTLKNTIIKLLSACGVGYLGYHIVHAIIKENIVRKAQLIRDQRIKFGDDTPLSLQKLKILNQADQYLQNHQGYKLMKRMKNQQFYDKQIKIIVAEKQRKIKQLEKSPQNQEIKKSLDKLKDQVQQLNKFYQAVRPKLATRIQDLQ